MQEKVTYPYAFCTSVVCSKCLKIMCPEYMEEPTCPFCGTPFSPNNFACDVDYTKSYSKAVAYKEKINLKRTKISVPSEQLEITDDDDNIEQEED